MGPGVNDAFVADVSVSPNSRTLFCVRVAWGFCKIHSVVLTCTRKPQIKRPTDTAYESWLLDLLPFVLCFLLYLLVKVLFP